MNSTLFRCWMLLLLCSASVSLAETKLDGELIYISAFTSGEPGAIYACRLDGDTGGLTVVHRTTDVENPFFMAMSSDRSLLFSIHAKSFGGKEDEQVAAYQVEGSGRLRLLNRQSARGSAACFLDVDATGKTVLVANYTSGSVAALPIKEDGSLGEASSLVQHQGSSVDPKRQEAPHAHSIVISPDNRFALAADLGLDKILNYRLDAAAAKLSTNQQPFVKTTAGAGPRHLIFHPDGKRVYAINELENSVTHFNYDVSSGTLAKRRTVSTLPEDFNGKSYCADLKITPDGRFLYGTNRGHDSLAAFRIGEQGQLKRLQIRPSLGKGPQNLAITPDGKLLLCANMPGNSVVTFRIDSETGKLSETGQSLEMPRPSCIVLVARP